MTHSSPRTARASSILNPCRPLGLFLLGVLAFTGLQPRISCAATIRSDGLLDTGSEVIYPLGLVELGTLVYENWNDEIRTSGANIVWDIEIAYADTIPPCGAVIDSATAGGYYLLIGSGDTWNWDNPDTPEFEVDRMMYEPPELDQLLACIGGSDRVVAFANRDEPVWTISRGQVGDIDENHVYETFDQIHADVPETVVGMNFASVHLSEDLQTWKNDILAMVDATDIVMHAAYPYPAGEGTCIPRNVFGYPECKLDRLAVGADIFLSELNNPGQPLWMIIQAFKDIPAKEAKWEAYACVVHGAQGIFWSGWTWWHPLGHGRANWPVIKPIIQEMSSVQPYLAGRDFRVVPVSNPHVEVRTKRRFADDVVAFAISRDGWAGDVGMRLPQAGTAEVEVVGEGRTLQAVEGLIIDHFDSYEAHGYRYVPQAQTQGGGDDPRPTGIPELAAGAESFTVTAYPNPSRGTTLARFTLPRDAAAIFTVYDATGRKIGLAGSGSFAAGVGEVQWNGRDLSGRPVASGIYFIRGITSHGETASTRVLIRR